MPSLAVKNSSAPAIQPLAPQGERRRRQLVEIASRLVADEGIQAASLPRVAELAGVGRTAIYRYFTQREDLLAAVENEVVGIGR